MMRRIVYTSLRFRVLVCVAAAGLLALGVVRLRDARADVYPEFTAPYVQVQTEALGLSAAEVEQLITVPLEADLLNGVAWLDDIRSESVAGLSSITLVFEPGTDLYKARQMVQERLAQAHAIPNVSRPPQMLQPVSSTSRTMMIGLSSETLSLIDISQFARWTIKPRLLGVEGVANVSTFGQRERQLQVLVDPKTLAEKGVSLQHVVETTGNALWVSPLTFLEASSPGTGGFIETPNQRLGVQHVQPIESAADLAQVAVVDDTGANGTLRLGDVARVAEDHQPLIGDARVLGKPGLVLVVEKLPNANTVDVTNGVRAALDGLRPGLAGLDIDTSIYQPAAYVHAAVGNVGWRLLAGLLLVVGLLLLAFRGWRSALVAVATILVSLTAAGLVLYARGTTVNTMVLAGLALALGAVIDDAVSGTERLAGRLREGDGDVVPTVVAATVEVRNTLTFATVFVLLPVVPVFFMGGVFGAFGRPLAASYALALIVSLVTAAVLTPALGLLLLGRAPGRASSAAGWLTGRYDRLLGRLLDRRRTVYALGVVVALVGLVALPSLRRSELPSLRERDFVVEVEAEPGTSLIRMNQIVGQATAELRAIPGVRNVASHVGRAVTGDKVVNVNSSALWVAIDDDADYGRTVAAIRATMAGFPGQDRDVLSYQQSRVKEAEEGADEPVVVRVYGQDLDVLTAKATEVRNELAKVRGIADLAVELPRSEPSIEVEVDLAKASRYGVKPGDVRRAAAVLVAGIEVGQLFYDQKVFEVVVWGTPETRRDVTDIRNLLIDTQTGPIRLSQVADVRLTQSPDVIEREGAFRRIDVTARVSGRSADNVLADVRRSLDGITFPLEYRAELLGGYQEKQAAEARLLWLGVLAAVVMLLLLQACFGSWRLGLFYFPAVLTGTVGAIVAALLLEGTVTVGAAVGLLAVLGVSARGTIHLVRRLQHLERREGEEFGLALVRRGAAERLAPALTTALATGLVFLPFAVAGPRPGLEIMHPMAVVVLGGLVTTLLVQLFLVPAIHLGFGDVASDAEIDLRLFEEELALNDRVPVPRTGDRSTIGAVGP